MTTPFQRFSLYAALNVAFMLIVGLGCAYGGSADPRVAYLLLLFALSSVPIVHLDCLNGRYALLAIFSAAYFVMFGLTDLSALIQDASVAQPPAAGVQMLSATEAVVLIGALMFYLGYRCAVCLGPALSRPVLRRDWARPAILCVGLLMWAIGTYATYHWYVYIITGTTNEEFRKGIQGENPYVISAFILAQLMQPLGILLVAYAWRVFGARLLGGLILAMVALQVALGFVVELKGLAMLGGILVIVTIILIEGRIPKTWLAGALIYALFVFPVFQAYRAEVVHNRGVSRTAVLANFGHFVELALSAKSRVYQGRDRAQTFLERSSLLGSVQIIVEKTGSASPYQHGHTLTPILAAFIPKVAWSDKPDVLTGQLLNRSFHITDSDDIFISPSHLGELYWNFGWWGVVAGMAFIGGVLGWVGTRFNLAHGRTVTRLLVTVVTIKQLVAGFESSIAVVYVVWLRSLAGIGLLHLVFARIPVPARPPSRRVAAERAAEPGDAGAAPFANLLR